MNLRINLIVALGLFISIGSAITTSDATTSFGGSTIIAIDQDQRTVTFRTKEGQTWTLPVSDPEVLKKQPIVKGDDVAIEIDLDDRISKVVKLSDMQSAPRTDTEDR
jgi:hypothetical protein